MTDIRIKESFRQRRIGGALLALIAAPITLFWLRFGLPLRYDFADLLFIAGGPGLLLLGLWAAFPRRSPQVRLVIGDDALRFSLRGKDRTIALDDLKSIRRQYVGRHGEQQLTFNTGNSSVHFDASHLTHAAQDIISLIAKRYENRGRHLKEGRARITGGPDGVWTVSEGNPFDNRD